MRTKMIMILFLAALFLIPVVRGQSDEMILELDQDYAMKNGFLNFTLRTTFDAVNVTIRGQQGEHAFLNKPDGFRREIDLTGYDSGYYELLCQSGSLTVTQWFTVVETGNLQETTFPLSAHFKGIDYVLFGNGTLRASLNGETVDLDFNWLKLLAKQEATEKSIVNNNMLVRASYSNPDTGYVCNVSFIKTYQGLKMLIYLDTPRQIVFDFDLDEAHSVLEGYKQGSIVFDYSDLLVFKQIMSVDKKRNLVTLTIPKGQHTIDPTIFASGFESGSTSGWSEYFGLGGVLTVINGSYVIDGSYSLNCTDKSGYGYANVYKSLGGNYKAVNQTFKMNIVTPLLYDAGTTVESLTFTLLRNVAHSLYYDIVRVRVFYNETAMKPVIQRMYNMTTWINTDYEVQFNKTYRVSLLLNVTADNCIFLMDGTQVFNDTYEFGNPEIDYGYMGAREFVKNATRTHTIICDSYEINNDPWVFKSLIYFHVRDFKDFAIEGVNVTLYDLDIGSYLDSQLTDSQGLAIFNHTYPTDQYGVCLFQNVVGKYETVTITANTNNNFTAYVQYLEETDPSGYGWFIGLVACVVSFLIGLILKIPTS